VLPLPALLLTGLAAEARSSTPGAPAAFARHQLKLTVLLHAAAARVTAPEADRQLQADGITKSLQIKGKLQANGTTLNLLLLLLLRPQCSSHLHAAAAAAACFVAGRMCFTWYCRRLLCSVQL
jgi:hypothetical protein